MRRSQLVFLAVFVAVSIFAGGAWLSREPVEAPRSPRETAEQLLSECQWAAAVEACVAVLRESPEDGEVWLWRGRGRLALGEYDEAAADFSEAIARLPQEAEPRYHRAMAYARLGMLAEAEADFEAARLLDPNKDKLRLALRDEEAAQAVRSVVQQANRTAEARSTQRQLERAQLANQRVAALNETNNTNVDFPDSEIAGKNKVAPRANGSTDDGSAFARLTAAAGFEKRAGALATLPSTPQELLSQRGEFRGETSGRNLLDEPSELERGALHSTVDERDHLANRAEANHVEHIPAGPAGSGVETAPQLSAWEQFQQRQSLNMAGGANRSVGFPSSPFALRNTENSNASLSDVGGPESREADMGNAALPTRTAKYPVRSWTARLAPSPSATSQPAAWPLGPLGARAAVGQPLSTAQPSVYPSRGPENALSTAMIPLPAPAVDMSAAIASAPPGVLSMAIQELFAPSAANANPPLATYTAPLPGWVAPPASAMPKRR